MKTKMYVIQMKDWFKKSKGLELRLPADAYYAWNLQSKVYVTLERETEKAILIKIVDHGLLDNYYKDKKLWIPRSQLIQFEEMDWNYDFLK